MNPNELGETHKKAWIGLFVTHGLVTRAIDERLSKAGMVPLDVYDVLLMLEEAPENRLRLSDLAARALLTRSGMTRMIDRLEKQGLVCRKGCTRDGRVQFAVLTEKGLYERVRAWEVYRQGISDLFAVNLSEIDAKVVADSLCAVATKLGGAKSIIGTEN